MSSQPSYGLYSQCPKKLGMPIDGSILVDIEFDNGSVRIDIFGETEEAPAKYYKDLPWDFGFSLVDRLIAKGLITKEEKSQYFRALCRRTWAAMPKPPKQKTGGQRWL